MKTIIKDKKLDKKKKTIKNKKKYKSRTINDIIPGLTKKNSIKLKELIKNAKNKTYDLLFLNANNYIEKDANFKDASDIYIYLMNNNYNKENIAKWLLYHSPEYDIRANVFNKLIKVGQITDEDKLKNLYRYVK